MTRYHYNDEFDIVPRKSFTRPRIHSVPDSNSYPAQTNEDSPVRRDEITASREYQRADKNKDDSNKNRRDEESDKSKKTNRKDKERNESESEDEENQSKSMHQNKGKGRRQKWLYPDKFDGSTSFSFFHTSVEICASYNDWDEKDKLVRYWYSLHGTVSMQRVPIPYKLQQSQQLLGLIHQY